ncbi:septum formation initiator family protein [Sphaerimonospora cavernae]|uniref:Septum formation initiator family protein n=1 Tax=Sphaerimonospora cavernae TaxID=1740611 RepID=A0ABV6U4A3_9ACTN
MAKRPQLKRPQLTGRAAILAVVVCANAMSLAYPAREVIAQRREIARLEEEQTQALHRLRTLEERRKQREDPEYVKQMLKERLHYCEPGAKCYVVLDQKPAGSAPQGGGKKPEPPAWYVTLWQSVEAADQGRDSVPASRN